MKIYTIKEVSKIMQIHPEVIRRHAVSGKLPGTKINRLWRFTQKDLEIFIENGRTKHASQQSR